MGANLKTGFVIDVEATCWETKEEQWTQPNEIIEIGVAELQYKTGKVIKRGSIVVKPRFTKVTPFCTQLTGWTQEQIDKGFDIVDALAEFDRLFRPTQHQVWFAVGEYDRHKLSSLTTAGVGTLYGVSPKDNPFDRMRSFINIKTMFALKMKLDREPGMAKMMSMIGAKMEGRHHNGSDDAFNSAKIVSYVLS